METWTGQMGARGCSFLPEAEDSGGSCAPTPAASRSLSGNSSQGDGGLLPLSWHLLEEPILRGPGKAELPSSRRHATLAATGKGQDSLGLHASPGRTSELGGGEAWHWARDTYLSLSL